MTSQASQDRYHAERVRRAKAGSKRKRDQQALAAEEAKRLHPPADVVTTERAARILSEACAYLRDAGGVPAVQAEMWLDPLRAVGERKGALCVVGRGRVYTWVTRRYAKALGDAVRAVSDLAGVFIYLDPHPEVEPEAVTLQ